MDYVLCGGPFHTACQDLLKSGYSLPWVDRYPVYRLELPVVAYGGSGECLELDPTLAISSAPATAMKMDRGSMQLAQDAGAASTSSGFPTESAFEFDDRLSELVTSKPRPRSGRLKYACKSCHIQLWGKPGLNVVCGDCEVPLTEVI